MTIEARNGLSGAERRKLAIERLSDIVKEMARGSESEDAVAVQDIEHVLEVFRESQE